MNGRCQGFYCGADVADLVDNRGDLSRLDPAVPDLPGARPAAAQETR
jgi:hypothetical protein